MKRKYLSLALQLLMFLAIVGNSAKSLALSAISGPSSICVNQTVIFTDATAGGTWSSSSSIVTISGTSGTATITGLSAGTTTITYTDGASFVTATLIVYPKPVIWISGRDSICPGSHDTLTAHDSLSEMLYYVWHGAYTSCAVCDTNITFCNTTQTYSITATNASGCADTAYFTVHVSASHQISVSPSPAIICRDSSIQLLAVGAAGYLWYPVSGLSCTTCPNPVATDSVSTNYFVSGINSYGCHDTTLVAVTVDTACTTGIPIEMSKDAMTFYPNPATSEIYVTSNEPITSIAIINALGQITYQQNFNIGQVRVDIRFLPAGTYFIRINNEIAQPFRKE